MKNLYTPQRLAFLFCCLLSLFSFNGFAQVGIGTTNPQTGLHIAGANNIVRIESLNNANNAYNNGTDPSVVMVDANGDLSLRSSVDDFPIDASDTGTGSEAFMASPIAIQGRGEVLIAATGYTVDITLTRTTLVEVAFWTTVKLEKWGGGSITDGRPRLFGGLVTETNTDTDIVYSASSYTSHNATGTITTGYFTIGGNGFITLPAGTHTIELVLFANGGWNTNNGDSEGIRATFGANTYNRFQIVYHN